MSSIHDDGSASQPIVDWADSPAGAVTDVLTDDEWADMLAESREAARRSHWGRFMRLYGDEADPRGDTALSDDELLARLADAEALTTQLMALQARDLGLLRQRRLDEQATARPADHDPGSCTRGCCDDDGWVTLEVAQALALTERQVERRLDTAARLERYEVVAEAVREGLLQSWTATKLLDHLDALAPHVSALRLATIEQVTVAWLTDRPRTVGQLTARMRRLLLQVRAGDGSEDEALTAADRHVRVVPPDTSGLATLIARLPEVDAVAIAGTLTALAHDPVDVTDGRTQEQRRCDLVTASITGMQSAHGCAGDLDLIARLPGSLSVRLDVTIPVTSLCGGDAPALIPGYGTVPASTARSLAVRGGDDVQARPLVYDAATGRLLGAAPRHQGLDAETPIAWLSQVLPSRAYAHPPVMDRLLRLRDATCRAPGCTRRAHACDCDHVVPYPDGPTSLENSCCLCRRHHRLKTHAPGWSLSLQPDGTAAWTTPSGRTLTTTPADYRSGDGSPDGSHDRSSDEAGDGVGDNTAESHDEEDIPPF